MALANAYSSSVETTAIMANCRAAAAGQRVTAPDHTLLGTANFALAWRRLR
jgi:hypothetical protein